MKDIIFKIIGITKVQNELIKKIISEKGAESYTENKNLFSQFIKEAIDDKIKRKNIG